MQASHQLQTTVDLHISKSQALFIAIEFHEACDLALQPNHPLLRIQHLKRAEVFKLFKSLLVLFLLNQCLGKILA